VSVQWLTSFVFSLALAVSTSFTSKVESLYNLVQPPPLREEDTYLPLEKVEPDLAGTALDFALAEAMWKLDVTGEVSLCGYCFFLGLAAYL
jgi:hypothetical protein